MRIIITGMCLGEGANNISQPNTGIIMVYSHCGLLKEGKGLQYALYDLQMIICAQMISSPYKHSYKHVHIATLSS